MNEFKNALPCRLTRPTMPHMIGFFLLLVLLSACGNSDAVVTSAAVGTSPATGQTYYVKSGGNDGAAGTSDGTAWATISKVTTTAKSGDTVYFRSQDTWSNSDGTPVLTGVAGVTYIGNVYGSGTRAKLTTTYIGAPDQNNNKYTLVKLESSNITLRGFEVDVNSARIYGISVGSMSPSGITGVTVDNCNVHHVGGISGDWNYAIIVSNKMSRMVANSTISNNIVHDNFHEGIAVYSSWTSYNNRSDNTLVTGNVAYNNTCGVEIANDANNVTVANNEFYNNTQGIVVRVSPIGEGPTNVIYGPRDLIIRNNRIYNNSKGIDLWSSRSTIPFTGSIYNNLIYNNSTPDTFGDCSDFKVTAHVAAALGTAFSLYNNTLYSTQKTCSNSHFIVDIGGNGYDLTSNIAITFKNNVLYYDAAADSSFAVLQDRWSILTQHSNNLIYRSSGVTHVHVKVGGGGTNYDRNGGATDLTNWEPTAKKNDPLFVSTVTPDFQLQSGSPAINAGVDVGLKTDYLGNAIAGLPDIGAYEF